MVAASAEGYSLGIESVIMTPSSASDPLGAPRANIEGRSPIAKHLFSLSYPMTRLSPMLSGIYLQIVSVWPTGGGQPEYLNE